MKFLENNYKAYSVKWIIQRTIIVVKEGRLPQIGLSLKIKKLAAWLGRKGSSNNTAGTENGSATMPMMEVKIPESRKQSNSINSYFDCIYLLNLKHRSDKRLKSIYQFKKLGIKAIIADGINGHLLPYKEEYERYLSIPLGEKNAHPLEKKYNRKMISSPGGWGVLKSKKLIFLHAMKNNYKRILILQDDMFFIEDFHDRFESFINIIDNDWKIIALGATQHSWNIPTSLYYKDPGIKEYDPEQKFYYPLKTDGAFALGYDHSVFQFIIDKIDKMNCSFDSGAVRSVYENYKTKCYVCQPNLIIADVSTSDIRGGRDQEEFSVKMKWNLSLYDRTSNDELVSVIMPAYNAEQTIEKSIRSVLLQTYQNLELIVVDDGSTDNTGAIVRQLAKEDERIVYQRNDQNRGCYFVRNDALRLSKGKYIAIQDADDISLSNRLEKQLIPIVSGNALFVVGKIIRSDLKIDSLDLSDENTLYELINNQNQTDVNGNARGYKKRLGLNTTMFHRDLFTEYGLFWENRFGSDAEILERVIYKKTGIIQPDEDQTIHDHFAKFPHMPEIYSITADVLLISPEMNNENLSNLFSIKGPERKEFRKKYREVLLGKSDSQYPVF